MCPIDFGVPRLWLQCVDNWKWQGKVKWFRRISAFSVHLLSWDFTHRLPMSQGCALVILGSNVKVIMDWLLKMVIKHNSFSFSPTCINIKLHTETTNESRIDVRVTGLRSRSQCIDVWNCFWLIIALPYTTIIKLHMKTSNKSVMCPIDLGSKSQRSRSQCGDYWELFMVHNCFHFIPIIMKLHTQTPHESRMSSINFGVKRAKIKVTIHWCLEMILV